MKTSCCLATSLLLAACSDASAGLQPDEETFQFLSPVYDVDGLYRSMMGPRSREYVQLTPEEEAPELLWVTGFEAVMVGGDGATPMPQEFMCHSNFSAKEPYVRLFTLSQGQLAIRFPDGFGLPVMSDEVLSVETQVLNLNEPDARRQVRHKLDVTYVRDRDLERPFTPLEVLQTFALVSLEDEPVAWNVEHPDALQEEACCVAGAPASRDSLMKDEAGRRFSGHYVVEPGRHEFRTLVTGQMKLEHDTRIHYIAAHLHPFAEYVELRDLTAGETVHRSYARQFDDRIGLEHVDDYSSAEGLPLYADHEYEIVSLYDNTSGEEQDSMAVMLLYVEKRDFRRPAPPAPNERRARRSLYPELEGVDAPDGLVVETLVAGDGPAPEPGDMVVVHFTAAVGRGEPFQSTYARGMPFAFALGTGRIVQGLQQGILRMRVGEKARLTVPPELGFGRTGGLDGTIPPDATLTYVVELVELPELGIEVLAEGTGPAIRSGRTARVHYTGWLDDGTLFASSRTRGEPFTFPLDRGQVIPGWDRGVDGMKVGEKRRLIVPPSLGYGPAGFGAGVVPPNARLTYEVELLGIE